MTGRAVVDVCVVGGGIVGLALGRELALRGRSVQVLESQRVGERSAANVAAGMLAPASEVDLSDSRLTEFALAAHAMYPEWCAALARESGLDAGFDATGTLIVALHHDHLALLERLYEFQRERGLTAERLSAASARDLEPCLAPGVIGALRTEDTQVDPRRAMRALVAAIAAAGGVLEEGAEVSAIVRDGDTYALTVRHGESEATVHASQVVLAGGAWSARVALPAGLPSLPMRPVKGQVVRVRGERLIGHVVRTPDVYLVPRADGELVIGATMEEMGFDARSTAGMVEHLLREAQRVLPGIAELELTECGVGFRPALRDHLPAIGSLDGAGLFVATGHFRNGVELAPITAQLLADVMCEGRTDPLIAPFTPARFATVASA